MSEVLIELQLPSTWENPEHAQRLGKERNTLQSLVHTIDNLTSGILDNERLLDWALMEEDQDILTEIIYDIEVHKSTLERLEFMRMFCHKTDANNAFLDIQSGSGGTEAQDWAEMLMRMYLRFGESHGFKTELTEISSGEITGVKGCTICFQGGYAYGWLKTETGIHRLVRKSPFDSGNRRHTSFASVFVYPEVDNTIKTIIKSSDLRIDTYRASGAGGQHVNRTDSAVRITHQPTGIVVQCQNNRSQHKNKDQAMKQLQSKLYKLEIQKRNVKKQVEENSKSDIGWGSQIRSYVLDKSIVKDLRTGIENTNTQAVLNGDLDKFIRASLKMRL